MNREEKRKQKKTSKKSEANYEKMLNPFINGDTMYIPVLADQNPLMKDQMTPMTPDEFMHMSYTISDAELNRIIYRNAKAVVEKGLVSPWPKDDYGIVRWFTWNFITKEMREAFPFIAKEYLDHFRLEDDNAPKEFMDIPYPRVNEITWNDAYYFRVLLMMLYSARAGSTYSKNILISLYKIYFKQEYNKVKKLKILTYLDVLEMHDEDCKRRGLPSGHSTDGFSLRDHIINERMHEAGWTNVHGDSLLSPVPRHVDGEDAISQATSLFQEINDAPDEPPLQPVSARLFIMCELLGIPIENTCNEQANHMNMLVDGMNTVTFASSPEYRFIFADLKERTADFLHATYPEMFDPFEYQRNEHYLALQMAEQVMRDVFMERDIHIRVPYESKKFDLADLVSSVSITMFKNFPELRPDFNVMLELSMIRYLAECICEIMNARDQQLEDILHFHRKYEEGELRPDETDKGSVQKDKVLKSVENLHSAKKEEPKEEIHDEDLRAEVERLRQELEEKSSALVESEQKVIQQRSLYELAHKHELELEQKLEDMSSDHAELVAMREYVYDSAKTEEIELDEDTREDIIEAIKDKKVAVLGGTEKWIKRMKRLLPSWSYVSVDDTSIGGFNALERADYIYVYTSALKHKQYYRCVSMAKNTGKMLFYLNGSNVDVNLAKFQKDLCR